MKNRQSTDFLIIGGGVIGINLAINAKSRYPESSVTLIEKEKDCGIHASGRNSGVLHAGFYYTADSLKAKFTVDGNRALTEYCEERGLPINKCGKLVVAKSTSEVEALSELLKRGLKNGVDIQEINVQEAIEIEPRVKTTEKALWSPTTSSVDPQKVMSEFIKDAKRLGAIILTDTRYIDHRGKTVITSRGSIEANYVINAAGLYADKIAQDYGFSENHRIIPFKGLYLVSSDEHNPIKTHIYPVPNLDNPFLGVHFTVSVNGKVKIGPTAIPAFWREHYNGFHRFNLAELFEIVGFESQLYFRNEFGFRRLAMQELAKYQKSHMVKLAQDMATEIKVSHYRNRGPAGIRAQLFETKKRKLEMDFHFEGDDNSFHVLNAVSPAFTCSIPFTDYLFDRIDELIA